MTTPLHAVILTGSRDSQNPLLAGTSLYSKVLLPVGGQPPSAKKPMVQWVFDAITATKYSPSMYISSSDLDIKRVIFSKPYHLLPSENKAVTSFLKSLERIPSNAEWVLLVSGDHVLLTPEMIEYFVDEVIHRDLTLGVAVVQKSVVDQAYPESVRTYMPMKGDAYSGGNMYLVNKPRFLGNAQVLETIDRNRKKPWKSVFMLDPWSVLRILTRQMDMHELAKKASKIIGCTTGVVEMPFAECCMDVDKQSDKEIAEQILQKRAEAALACETVPPQMNTA